MNEIKNRNKPTHYILVMVFLWCSSFAVSLLFSPIKQGQHSFIVLFVCLETVLLEVWLAGQRVDLEGSGMLHAGIQSVERNMKSLAFFIFIIQLWVFASGS